MASASSSSAKLLFQDSKKRLADRVAININNAGSVARQIHRGSKSTEILMGAAKSLAHCEPAMDSTEKLLRKMQVINEQRSYQIATIKEGADKLEIVQEQASAMER